LNNAIDSLGRLPTYASLLEGYVGVAWVIEHLRQRHPSFFQGDPNEVVDTAVLDLLRDGWDASFDLVSGLVGLGVYFLERDSARSHHGLAAVLDRLGDMAMEDEAGIFWRTEAHHLPRSAQKRRETPYVDLGVAHGVPGVIGLLSHCMLRGRQVEPARRLLDRCLPWFRHQGRKGEHSIYGYAVGKPEATRLAWCYGDLGISRVLYLAGRASENEALVEESVSLARSTLAWSEGEDGIVDLSLCHGAGGVGHIYSRFFFDTGLSEFRQGALKWFSYCTPRDEGRLSGAWHRESSGEWEWSGEDTFLEGAAGVGLALLAACGMTSCEWDSVLLL
jgi:hypothetical protein